jgi:hypothetical protein
MASEMEVLYPNGLIMNSGSFFGFSLSFPDSEIENRCEIQHWYLFAGWRWNRKFGEKIESKTMALGAGICHGSLLGYKGYLCDGTMPMERCVLPKHHISPHYKCYIVQGPAKTR